MLILHSGDGGDGAVSGCGAKKRLAFVGHVLRLYQNGTDGAHGQSGLYTDTEHLVGEGRHRTTHRYNVYNKKEEDDGGMAKDPDLFFLRCRERRSVLPVVSYPMQSPLPRKR